MRRKQRRQGGRPKVVVVIVRVGFPGLAGGSAWALSQSEEGMWAVAIFLGLVAVALALRSIRDV